MAGIRVGLCSWTDPQLLQAGTFYPAAATDAESRLRFYSKQFPVVEVDSSYYALPSAATASLWAERTPEDFVFHLKAFSLFTNHPTKLSALPRDIRGLLGPLPDGKTNLYYRDVPEELRAELWRRYVNALAPLRQANKMGRVLLQFPPWFYPSRESEDHILTCVDRLKPLSCSVEFRQRSWLSEKHSVDTIAFLREHNLTFVCVDEPQGFRSSVPPVVAATSDLAIVRFHGRNADTWEKKGLTTAERFNWNYSVD
ncbi:MAG: DUF72 domain-containing protein, partial [Dehalococcoidia bacterium]|nr:DUF72 domain-containing protein [Dehalococcoidia bacterium]